MIIQHSNNTLIRSFLTNNNAKQDQLSLFSNIIYTLNPLNSQYSSTTVAKRINEKSHKVFIKLTYHFDNNFSAKLFQLIFKHIIAQNQFLITTDLNENNVSIELKNGIYINHTEKFSKKEEDILKMEKSFAYREDSQILSEVFINTLDTIYFSNLINDKGNNTQNLKTLILQNINSAISDRVNNNNGRILFNKIKHNITQNKTQNNNNYLIEYIKKHLFLKNQCFSENTIENRYL